MNLLFYRYGSICEPDIIQSFENLGFEVDEDTREVYKKDLLPSECITGLSKLLLKKKYSFVFSINFYPAVSETCMIHGIPYLCLIVDSPIIELFSDSLKNPCNKVFIFDKKLFEEFHQVNPKGIFHIPLAANVTNSTKVRSSASRDMCDKFAGDISFIGSLYSEKCPYNEMKPLSDKWHGYVDGLIESQIGIYGYNFIDDCISDELVQEFCRLEPKLTSYPSSLKVNLRSVIGQQYISVKVAEQERIRLLTMLSNRFDVNLYTGSDTSGMPNIHNKGYAKTATEMPLIFNNSKINLNITAKSIRSGLSLRVFDVLGSEGFLITNYQEELPDYFAIGEDLESYSSADDLMTKCEYYLTHEKDRKEIAHNGFEKVGAQHNYDLRIEQMLQIAFNL